jgi:ABC-type nitrate/sulfonate/bicarbonate transport system substrate-binding protein
MCLRTRTLLASLVLLTLAAPTAAQLRKFNIAYTATSPYQAVLIIAKEAGVFKKHGLDPQLILTPGGSLGSSDDGWRRSDGHGGWFRGGDK